MNNTSSSTSVEETKV